jgi:hypothetical protein
MNAAVLSTIRLLTSIPDKLPDEAAEQAAAVDLAVRNALAPVEKKLVAAEKRSHAKALGITLTLLGLAAVGGGAAWYFLDDDNENGLITAAGGGGLAAGGIGVLVF